MMMSDRTDRQRNDRGQAMSEFVIILFVIMILCSGMLYVSRLLTFQFWAQQEARLLAYEQTWAPHWAYTDPYGDPVDELENGSRYRRPRPVERIQDDASKNVDDDGDVVDLIGVWAKADPPESAPDSEAPIVLAKRTPSLWHQRTDEWFRGEFSLVANAFAVTDSLRRRSHGNDSMVDEPPRPRPPRSGVPSPSLEEGFERALEYFEFGESQCDALGAFFDRRGAQSLAQSFSKPGCAAWFNREFGTHLAQNVHIPNFYRDWGYQMDWGLDTSDALQVALEREVAGQYYSFFDTTVTLAFPTAVPFIVAQEFEIQPSYADFFAMMGDARYIGSSVALGIIRTQMTLLTGTYFADADQLKAFEDVVTDILHVDAADFFGAYAPGVDNGFFLSPAYLPVPPYFSQLAGSLQTGLMTNVLSNEDGGAGSVDDLVDTLIEQSNKQIVVEYPAQNGLFPAAVRRWGGDKTLRSTHYLITQPWHITRRESPFGAFREKGGQFDTFDEETEEAMLRRRVGGLWLLPSDMGAMLQPMTDLLPGQLGGLVNAFEGVSGFLGDIIGFVKNNPLNDILNFLADIPGIGNLVPTFPEWPTVRPGAYPGSTELTGNNPNEPDMLMDEPRNFEDYVDEQQSNNPSANPTFH